MVASTAPRWLANQAALEARAPASVVVARSPLAAVKSLPVRSVPVKSAPATRAPAKSAPDGKPCTEDISSDSGTP